MAGTGHSRRDLLAGLATKPASTVTIPAVAQPTAMTRAVPRGDAEAGANRMVVLLRPETLDRATDVDALRKTFAGPPARVRVLLYLAETADDSFVGLLAELGVEFEVLLGPNVEPPQTDAYVLRALPGITPSDLSEFALALSDVVLARAGSAFSDQAQSLHKRTVVPGEPLPEMQPAASISTGLDPESRGAWRKGLSGRLEQFALEAFACGWASKDKSGAAAWARSATRLRKCFGRKWGAAAYFAPDNWTNLAPDSSARDNSHPIVSVFEMLDRSALHGSFVHRDIAWLEHLLAACAVLVAVAGAVWPVGEEAGIVELLILGSIALMAWLTRRARLQDWWTACRFAAEQLRIARMSLPLLVLPPALATEDRSAAAHASEHAESNLEHLALAEVKRIVRDHGLPRLDRQFSPKQAADWLHLIIADQRDYHENNVAKLEKVEKRLGGFTLIIFLLAVAAVVAHFFLEEARWLLLFTAAAPAFAAAFHAVGLRLGIVHRLALSEETGEALDGLAKDLERWQKPAPPTAQAWSDVRRIAYRAAEAMGIETTSWQVLVKRVKDDLPA